jgi:hypothetical protein
MPDRASIALACAVHAERTCVSGWLTDSGYDPIALPDLSRLDENLHSHAVEALIADVAYVPREDDVRSLVRRLGSNRPLVLLGDASRLPHAVVNDLSVITRPLDRDNLLLTVGLALAECRPVRQHPRRAVEPIQAMAQGVSVTIREASIGGVGLEMQGARQVVLPPYFSLRIPEFGVHVLVKRAWMAPVAAEVSRCGGIIEGDLAGATRPWSEFAREAPSPVASVKRRMAIRRQEPRPLQA